MREGLRLLRYNRCNDGRSCLLLYDGRLLLSLYQKPLQEETVQEDQDFKDAVLGMENIKEALNEEK